MTGTALPGSVLPARSGEPGSGEPGAGEVGPGEHGRADVRPAVLADRPAVLEMFGRCTLETRYHRFHAPVRAIPGEYLTEALSGSPFHHALVVRPAGTDERIVALASCRVFAEGAAELGLLIEDGWQRRGLGTRLLADLVAHARQSGLRVLEAQLLAEQAWITGMLRRYGPCRQRWSRGEGRVTLPVQPPPGG